MIIEQLLGKDYRKKLVYGLDIWLPLALFGIVMFLILPMPAFLLDGALALSIAISLLMLLVILYLKESADFTGFPTMLLIATLFRLSLNVASTRLILLDGYAGNIIEAFGNFVVKGNFIVGLVVFIILVLVNFIVITKGAGRIAEVAARFTLDAMPGKQMAIDAELNAGVIDEIQAREKRKKVEGEADFYGAMDGASKFVRGDAIAGILITIINVIGGFGIGIFQRQMSVMDALELYTLLSIGDGLVSQIPALITSAATGILVTRATAKNNLGRELTGQLFFSFKAIWILAAMLGVMMFIPGFPFLPFFTLAVLFGLAAWYLPRLKDSFQSVLEEDATSKTPGSPQAKGAKANSAAPAEQPIEQLLKLDPIQVELGFGLVHLADESKNGDLLPRITGIRKNFARDMGLIVPPIKVKDNLQLQANDYRLLLKGEERTKGQIQPGQWMAMNATDSKEILKGIPTKEPVYQLPATWITAVEKKNAELKGFTVVDATTVLVTHLSETIKRNAAEILSRQDVQHLLDHLQDTHSAVINELIPAHLTVGHIHRILQNLLAEGLSIRNLPEILERISDMAPHTKNPDELSEQARQALSNAIAKQWKGEDGYIHTLSLDPEIERAISEGIRKSATEVALVLEPNFAWKLVDAFSVAIQKMTASGFHPVLVCGPQIRIALYRFLKSTFSDLAVIGFTEIPNSVPLKNFAVVNMPDAEKGNPLAT
ncbi:MAG: flagellar biosynthesis protein FlhA [Verrucomicrobia bacterium]|nr:flagellar biosynthesis protein FlhA [Verrucomicrobiota bacterium]MBT4273432.1 flagellar biosynthesis protein FlhA [Verrucomicrobiota bacterium]MBT5063786.1 flagellar biosynthesis protein FlhA [Verrucomicrobiota bacterium]MBT5477456.1 flagellar biosynthesis protein FlhA [Verrucomicrobiota bacterium]MBT6238419.1 flagellar biosynthesis protein FlhA [Verrucomicrobiota bacterium]